MHIHAAALSGEVASWLDRFGPWVFYVAVFALVFSGTGLFIGAFVPFITGDSLIFAAGLLAATSGTLTIQLLVTGVGLAAFLGDQVGFVLGRHYGRPYLQRREGPRIQAGIARSERFYAELGWWAVVVARYMPWLRVFVPAVAGIAGMNYYRFLSANAVGAVTWGVGLTLAGYYSATVPAVKSASYGIAAFFIAASVVVGLRSWWRNRRAAD